MVIDSEMQVLPSDPAAVALASAIAGDAMAEDIETTELFDVDVDEFARMLPFIAAHRLSRFQSFQ